MNLILSITLAILAHPCQGEPVTLPNFGQVIGVTKSTLSKGSYRAYYGIPFAKPPVGDLRFAKPQKLPPVEDWKNNKYPASEMDKICIQLNSVKEPLEYIRDSDNVKQSEDCLYLNIFVPLKSGKLPPQPLPVMVFVHGGAFVVGSAKPYEAGGLAVVGQVVVVTINYRLNIFGFGQANHPNAPGNVGLYDQAMAFRWVKENIGHFKGDPSSITAFGQSAGSISIGLLMLSRETRGIFDRAILESGTPLNLFIFAGRSAPIWMEKMAIELGCPIVSRNETKAMYANFTDETIKCLKAVPAEKLRSAQKKLSDQKEISMFFPSIDGQFLTDNPFHLFQQPDTSFDPSVKNIILGHCSAEGSFFIPFVLPQTFPKEEQLPSSLSYNSLKSEIGSKASPAKRRKLLDLFDFSYDQFDPKRTANATEIMSEVTKKVTDMTYTCQDKLFLDSYTKVADNKVHFYLFHYRQEESRKKFAPWEKRAIHTDDLAFIMGKGFIEKNYFTDAELHLSLQVITDWTNYASRGKPNDQWKPCTANDRGYLLYDINSTRYVHGYINNTCEDDFDPFIAGMIKKYEYITAPSF